MLNEHQNAIQDFNKAIEINSMDADSFNKRGESKKALNNSLGALDDFTKSIEIEPRHAIAHRNRGNIRFELYRLNHGCADWRVASRLGDHESDKLLGMHCQSNI